MKRFLMIHSRGGWPQKQERGIYEETIAQISGEGELVSVSAFHDHAVLADLETEPHPSDGVFIGGSSDGFLSGNTIPDRNDIQEEMYIRYTLPGTLERAYRRADGAGYWFSGSVQWYTQCLRGRESVGKGV